MPRASSRLASSEGKVDDRNFIARFQNLHDICEALLSSSIYHGSNCNPPSAGGGLALTSREGKGAQAFQRARPTEIQQEKLFKTIDKSYF